MRRAAPVLLFGLACQSAVPGTTIATIDATASTGSASTTGGTTAEPTTTLTSAGASTSTTTAVTTTPSTSIPDPGSSSSTTGGTTWLEGQNPVLPADHPDPGVLRTLGPDGPVYHLTSTVHNGGDFPRYTSPDLIHWTLEPEGLFHRTHVPGDSLDINGAHYCSRWAPELHELGESSYMLTFSAQRFAGPQTPCPNYGEDGGVYHAWSSSPAGPFALAEKPWEPLPAGAHISNCAIREQLPRSLYDAEGDCQGTFCHHIIRLDSTVFRDPQTGRWWLAYAWYTNTPPQVDWEQSHHGEHVHLVELDAADPFTVRCDANVAQIHVADPHDADTLARLAASCIGCDQMLSMVRGRQDEEMLRDGVSWGVTEGPSLMRRGDYVYLFLSGSAWDSAYYHVYWVAAPTVEGLSLDNPDRLVGRFLIPSDGQAFGHGTAVQGPVGDSWYFVHHRLDHPPCQQSGACARDVWVSPIEFEDRGDGLGEVHIRPRWPAKDPSFQVEVLTG